jgi:hypothetical protein
VRGGLLQTGENRVALAELLGRLFHGHLLFACICESLLFTK